MLANRARSAPEAGFAPHPSVTAEIGCRDFDLRGTLLSGQVFRWRSFAPGEFLGWIGGRLARVRQQGGTLSVTGASPEAVGHFFSLDADLPAIARRIDVDPVIHGALRDHAGLRIIRQEPWECAAAFILSAFNNIARLTGMLDRLAAEYGEPVAAFGWAGVSDALTSEAVPPKAAGRTGAQRWKRRQSALPGSRNYILDLRGSAAERRAPSRGWPRRESPVQPEATIGHRFPRPEAIARASERALRACGLGYRAPYLKEAAEAVASGRADLRAWARLEDGALRERLLELPGVGEKVAECVMLFGYGRAAAFPVDVWIARAMRAWYFRGRRVTDRRIREFARAHFGPECGWAQQYLYCRARKERAVRF